MIQPLARILAEDVCQEVTQQCWDLTRCDHAGGSQPCCSPLGTLRGRQDSVGQRHLTAVGGGSPSMAVVERPVGEEDIIVHAAQQERGEGDDEQELPGSGGSSEPPMAPQGTAGRTVGGGGRPTSTYTSSKTSESIMQAKPFFWWKW